MHQIWVIVDQNGKIQHCWEAGHPSSPEQENNPPISTDKMPTGWKVIKIKPPELLRQFQFEAQAKKKSLSEFILDECEIDDKVKPIKPTGLLTDIEFKAIRRKV